ncbi:MAG: DUF6056 family protein [Kiritimatiellia bacterium]
MSDNSKPTTATVVKNFSLKLLPWLSFALFLTAIYVLNVCFYFSSDDCIYGLTNTPTVSGVRVPLNSLNHVWIANWEDGYRPIVHFFVRLFTGVLEKSAFNITNTMVVGLLFLLIHRLALGTWRLSFQKLILLLTLGVLILFKGESYLWASGSLNYLWAGTWTLLFVLMREQLERAPAFRLTLLPMMIAAILFGWAQESFSVPICFALAFYSLFHLKKLSCSKILLFGCYGIGTFLLCIIASWRTETIAPPSLTNFIATQIKIGWAIKGVWIVALLFLITKGKRVFLQQNAFELLVILGSLLLISAVGFNGERCLWCANLFALIIVMREIKQMRWMTLSATIVLPVLLTVLILFGLKIRRNFDTFLSQFLASSDNVCCHERVLTGIFSRFFHQAIYTWQPSEGHGRGFAEYHGRKEAPIALSRELYENLYLKDSFCIAENQVKTAEKIYTTPTANAFIMPLSPNDTRDWNQFKVTITYNPPKNIRTWLAHERAIRQNPTVSNQQTPVVLTTSHGRYLLIVKDAGYAPYLNSIRFQPLQ